MGTKMAERTAGNFYGRRKAKPLKPAQLRALEAVMPERCINTDEPAPEDLRNLFADGPGSVFLEIGFGGGEHLINRAERNPDDGFIGCEPFLNGLAKAAAAIQAKENSNIRLYDRDATELLDWLPSESVDGIDLLYPDPWPKRRHWKRRFVNPENLDRFSRVLRPGGIFRFASDIDHYINWTLRHFFLRSDFEWLANGPSDWRDPFEHWQSTRYEQKAIRAGRIPAYLRFRKKI